MGKLVRFECIEACFMIKSFLTKLTKPVKGWRLGEMFSMLLSKLHYTINVNEIWKGGHDIGISIVHADGLVLLWAEVSYISQIIDIKRTWLHYKCYTHHHKQIRARRNNVYIIYISMIHKTFPPRCHASLYDMRFDFCIKLMVELNCISSPMYVHVGIKYVLFKWNKALYHEKGIW